MLNAAEPVKPAIYIQSQDGFDTYLAAAMAKKQVSADVVTNKEKADYLLKASSVAVTKESTGGKVARCLFLYCAGIEDRGNVSVQLIEANSSKVVWAYAVNKWRGHKNEQSMAEAVAKHLNQYLKLGHAARPAESTSTGIAAPVVLTVTPQQTKPSEPTNAPGATLLLPTAASAPVQNAQESVSARDNPTVPLAAGTVSITSTPDGADIFVDSVGSGRAPLILKVNSGMHAVQLTKSGYKDFVSEVLVTPDGIVNVTATLAK